ncbi:universal stress protein [Wenzhouxiangella sp. AB-CW3]|uniref:universal stress protein n=1 Tax=Wenzhouxiangella sp. AB-CW3 TaxID=2771012 RepID=UPI00168B7985|nr:universal stress protein [Wenzhouxiangella sp. AB-CW3]QOC22339.1 universal stress protein [Wenzhouxiangella sp. AB-CW3]
MNEFRKVVVAVDGSDAALRAARVAARLADSMNASLTMLHVFPMATDDASGALGFGPEALEQARQQSARKVFDETLSQLSDRPEKPEELALIGDPAEEIIEWLGNSRDILLVMGRRGQSKIGSLLLGSVSDKVIRHTHTPVTVVS